MQTFADMMRCATAQILALDHFKAALNDKEMEDFLFLGRPKDLKEAVGLAAEFEANRTARLQRQTLMLYI